MICSLHHYFYYTKDKVFYMKKSLAIISLAVFMFLFSGCSNFKVDPNSVDFYKNNGYFEIKSNSFIKPDLTDVDYAIINNTLLIKKGSNLSFDYNKLNEVSANNYADFIDYDNSTYISGFNVNGKFYDTYSLLNTTFPVICDYNISPVINKFKIVGIALYFISEFNENSEKFINDPSYLSSIYETKNNKLISKDDFLFYSYFNSNDNTYSNSNLITNIETKLNSNFETNNFIDIEFNYELPLEATYLYTSLIIYDENNNYKLVDTNKQSINKHEKVSNFSYNDISGKNSLIDNININLFNNLTVTDEY